MIGPFPKKTQKFIFFSEKDLMNLEAKIVDRYSNVRTI